MFGMFGKKSAEKITLWGIVQGVGFRPFVYKLAQDHNIRGYVKNNGGSVEIFAVGRKKHIDRFFSDLNRKKPEHSAIVYSKRTPLDIKELKDNKKQENGYPVSYMTGFKIISSDDEDDQAAMIPADIAVCDRCLADMDDTRDRRKNHPFVSCMLCGPRYSIADRFPYDRDNTTMSDFPMCARCEEEYNDPSKRRHHAQTISCNDCGPYPIYRSGPVEFRYASAISHAAEDLNEGGIIAFKGTGGYYLACRPDNSDTVRRLRDIKGREEKPFAVMFENIDDVMKYALPTDEEIDCLRSSIRPIVLTEKNEMNDLAPEVCRSSRFVGAFLPSIGLQYLLLRETGPLIMTSANRSDLPIIKDDDEMFAFADRYDIPVLYNTRRINIRLDDSVVRIVDGMPQLLRRSKGYVPVPIYIGGRGKDGGTRSLDSDDMIFAAGADLKSAFAVSKGNFSYLSEYFGDLDSLEKKEVYLESLDHMKTLFRIEPKYFACDMHPSYMSKDICGQMLASPVEIQHHHAHIASVMAEHELEGPVTGVAFDGTGYGDDGRIWGGEIMICEKGNYERFSHLKYIKMMGGDAGMKDAWKAGIAYKADSRQPDPGEFAIDMSEILSYGVKYEDEKAVLPALEQNINTFETSSMGRLFDAAASLLNLHHVNRYEGECANVLENAALRAMSGSEEKQDILALRFHDKVAQAVLEQCKKVRKDRGINKVALSGGVFQNRILTEEILKLLRGAGFEPYYNISVPPNDGGIALGQNYIVTWRI